MKNKSKIKRNAHKVNFNNNIISKNRTSLLFLVFLLSSLLISLLAVSSQKLISHYSDASDPSPTFKTTIKISPSRISPNESYQLQVKHLGANYNGLLDYDLTLCNLDFTNCKDTSGTWGNYISTNGIVNLPSNSDYSLGIYMVRFKPRNSSADNYSNFDVLMVDDKPNYPSTPYTSQAISNFVPGSYMVFSNKNINNNMVGYSRIDIETDPCDLGGITMRFTKSSSPSYWNPHQDPYGNLSSLRWCVETVNTPNGTSLRAIGGTRYNKPSNIDFNSFFNQILPKYSQDTSTSKNASLGGFFYNNSAVDVYPRDTDMYAHYSLLPFNNKIPNFSSRQRYTIIEDSFGHDDKITTYPGGTVHDNNDFIDMWHMEALKPSNSLSSITMRYNEVGKNNRLKRLSWKVTEDWDWSANGLIREIRQWTNIAERCWTPTYNCSPGTPRVTASLIESYIPSPTSADPGLTLSLQKTGTNSPTNTLTINNGESYDLLVSQINGSKYSGFLEVRVGTTNSIWKDISNKPIYVSLGKVSIPASAYGNLSNFNITFKVRPYLTNSTINTFKPIDSSLKPNTSDANFSNNAQLIIN